MNYVNIMEYPNLTLGKPFWIFIYEVKEYFIQKTEITINTGMSNNFSTNKYACHGAQLLILENWNSSKDWGLIKPNLDLNKIILTFVV